MKLTHTLVLVVGLVATMGITGCGKKETPAKETAAPAASETINTVEITGNDQMQFNTKTIEVNGGEKVTLTLKHVGKMTIDLMGHNFVLLEPGVDITAFGTAAIAAKETGYIPAAMKDKVIAHTKMLGGGESDTIVFDAPPPGTYKFICSFPGHYGVMQGDFIVN